MAATSRRSSPRYGESNGSRCARRRLQGQRVGSCRSGSSRKLHNSTIIMMQAAGSVHERESRLTACTQFDGDVLIRRVRHDSSCRHQVIANYREACSRARSITLSRHGGADHGLTDETMQQRYTNLLVEWFATCCGIAGDVGKAVPVAKSRLATCNGSGGVGPSSRVSGSPWAVSVRRARRSSSHRRADFGRIAVCTAVEDARQGDSCVKSLTLVHVRTAPPLLNWLSSVSGQVLRRSPPRAGTEKQRTQFQWHTDTRGAWACR